MTRLLWYPHRTRAPSMLSACATIAYEDILTEDKDAYAQYSTGVRPG